MKETIAVICADGLFAERPSISGVEDADGSQVKRYAVVCKITVEEIDAD